MMIPTPPTLAWSETLFIELLLPSLLFSTSLDYLLIKTLAQTNKTVALHVAVSLLALPYASLLKPMVEPLMFGRRSLAASRARRIRHQQIIAFLHCIRFYHFLLLKSTLDREDTITLQALVSKLTQLAMHERCIQLSSDRLTHGNRLWLALTQGIGLDPCLQPLVRRQLAVSINGHMAHLAKNLHNEPTMLKLLKALIKHNGSLLVEIQQHGTELRHAWLVACLLAQADSVEHTFFLKKVMRQHFSSLEALALHHGITPQRPTTEERLTCETFFLRKQILLYHLRNSKHQNRSQFYPCFFLINVTSLGLLITLGYLVKNYRLPILLIGLLTLTKVNLLMLCTKSNPLHNNLPNRLRLNLNEWRLRAMTSRDSLNTPSSLNQPAHLEP